MSFEIFVSLIVVCGGWQTEINRESFEKNEKQRGVYIVITQADNETPEETSSTAKRPELNYVLSPKTSDFTHWGPNIFLFPYIETKTVYLRLVIQISFFRNSKSTYQFNFKFNFPSACKIIVLNY